MRKRRDGEPIAAEIIVAAAPLRIPAEIFPANATEFQKALSKLVEKKVVEAVSGGDSTFEPWFRTKSVSNEIRKIQTVSEREKFSRYFEKWGCLICETKETGHSALGMCRNCHTRTSQRLNAIIRDSAPKEPQVFEDTAKLAWEAVEPSLEKLTRKRESKE